MPSFSPLGWRKPHLPPETSIPEVSDGQVEFVIPNLIERDGSGDLRLSFSVNGQAGKPGVGWVLVEEGETDTTLRWDGPYELASDDEVVITYFPK